MLAIETSPRGTNSLARASKENEPLASVGFQTPKNLPKKPTNAYTLRPPTRREINLDKKLSLSVGKRKSSNRGKNLANNFYSLEIYIYIYLERRVAVLRGKMAETRGGSALEMTRGFHNSVVVSTGLCSPRYVNPRWE